MKIKNNVWSNPWTKSFKNTCLIERKYNAVGFKKEIESNR